MWSRRWPRPATRARRDRRESAHRGNARDGNAGSARPPRGEQFARLVRTLGAEASAQKREFDQVVLRAAPANAFVLARERCKRLDRSGKILAFEGREARRQRRKVEARQVTLLARQRLDLAG